MGYEIIGTALFGVAFIWLSTQRGPSEKGGIEFLFPQGWRTFFFGYGLIHAIFMYALAAAPDAIILKGVIILANFLVFLFIFFIHVFTSVADLWNGTR